MSVFVCYIDTSWCKELGYCAEDNVFGIKADSAADETAAARAVAEKISTRVGIPLAELTPLPGYTMRARFEEPEAP